MVLGLGVERTDLGGPAVRKAAEDAGWNVLADAVVPDDKARIQEAIRSFAAQGCGLILTTGGTGIAERDVTPEATLAVIERSILLCDGEILSELYLPARRDDGGVQYRVALRVEIRGQVRPAMVGESIYLTYAA